ncbi:DNA polymerase III subunit beta [Homoserinibacter gongjuensis]|uniref:Beta sliding clamp n=1 Tax=Homoserinibacter gongjuensis TaxID=1162968 RepID=A0ABQ6JTF4_9MICO|nr:DNA polymerase III subunit beta [Homoserinibacter gongjuensis]GMA90678.1 DNA polymerase III subunit beta [Homoserinibacter gongjuensis]
MKFQVNRDVFSEAVSFAVKLLPQRTTQPILSGVLLEADGATLTLSSFDYEVSSRTEITAEVDDAGTALVSGRLLADIASRLPNAPVVFETVDGKIQVSCGSARFTLLSMPVEEYPTLPQVDDQTGVLPAEEFSSAVAQVAVAASRDDVTPVITGVQLEVGENNLSLVATDRYRVAVREIDWDSGTSSAAGTTALVPARTLSEIGKTFAHSGTIGVSIVRSDDRELIAFRADKKTVTSLLIKGNFPPVKRLFPETVENYAVLNTAELVEATRRVSLVLEREAALRFSFSATEGLTLEAAGSEQAQASETIDAHLVGDDTVVSLKPSFLLDGLGAVHSEFVRISFTKTENPNKPGPVLITSQSSREAPGSDNYKYLLQPNLLLR